MNLTKIFLTNILVLFFFSVQAQFEKKHTIIGVNYELFQFDIANPILNNTSLRVGHFFWDNLSIGLEAHITRSKFESNQEVKGYRLGLLGRYFINPKWEKVRFIAGLGTGFGQASGINFDADPSTDDRIESDSFRTNIEAGVIYVLHKNWSVELTHQYGWRFSKDSNNSFGGFHIGTNIHF